MNHRFFYINDLKLIGKTVNKTGYLYKNGTWEADRESVIQHRLNGYCPITKTTSNPYMLIKIDEITKEEAERLMNLFL